MQLVRAEDKCLQSGQVCSPSVAAQRALLRRSMAQEPVRRAHQLGIVQRCRKTIVKWNFSVLKDGTCHTTHVLSAWFCLFPFAMNLGEIKSSGWPFSSFTSSKVICSNGFRTYLVFKSTFVLQLNWLDGFVIENRPLLYTLSNSLHCFFFFFYILLFVHLKHTESIHLLAYSPDAHASRVGKGQSQETGMQFRFPTHVWGPSCLSHNYYCPKSALAGS